MVRRALTLVIFLAFLTPVSQAQDMPQYDSLKNQILALQTDVEQINLNLYQTQSKFQSGILIATLGYTTTITGGLMLGRSNDDIGQVLLVTGGAAGVIGTYKMVNAFRFLSNKNKRKP